MKRIFDLLALLAAFFLIDSYFIDGRSLGNPPFINNFDVDKIYDVGFYDEVYFEGSVYECQMKSEWFIFIKTGQRDKPKLVDRKLEDITVSKEECEQMVENKMCNENEMTKTSDKEWIFKHTTDPIAPLENKFIFQTNCAIKRHDVSIKSKSDSVMLGKNCTIEKGVCFNQHSTYVWKKDRQNDCNLKIIQKNVKFQLINNRFVSFSSRLVLNLINNMEICNLSAIKANHNLYLVEASKHNLSMIDRKNIHWEKLYQEMEYNNLIIHNMFKGNISELFWFDNISFVNNKYKDIVNADSDISFEIKEVETNDHSQPPNVGLLDSIFAYFKNTFVRNYFVILLLILVSIFLSGLIKFVIKFLILSKKRKNADDLFF